MRLFSCQNCGQTLHFENTRCERCGHRLGMVADDHKDLHALEPLSGGDGSTWIALGIADRTFRFCANAQHDVCNWLVDASSGQSMCAACRHNRVIPELGNAENRLAWRKIEHAKHRLFYTLFRLGLVQTVDLGATHEPLVFQFLADYPNVQGHKVMTGHEDGVVTIALSEAVDAEREQRRKAMGDGRWASLIAPCSDTSVTRSAIMSGIAWCATAANSRRAARCSATTRTITRRR